MSTQALLDAIRFACEKGGASGYESNRVASRVYDRLRSNRLGPVDARYAPPDWSYYDTERALNREMADRVIRLAAKFGKSEISRGWIDELCNLKEDNMPKTEERSTDHATAMLQNALSCAESLLKCRENDVKASEGTLARHRDLRDKCEAEVKSLKKALKKIG